MSIRVTLVEDNETIRNGLEALLNGTPGYICSHAYESCEALLKDISKNDDDIFLMDIDLGGMSGVDGVKKIVAAKPKANIIMLTVYEDDNLIFNALCAGASGYLTKRTPPARILEAIKEAYEGGSPMNAYIARKVVTLFKKWDVSSSQNDEVVLSLLERNILNYLATGKRYTEIADLVFISVSTVRYHIGNIYKKLHATTQTEAIAKAVKKGLI